MKNKLTIPALLLFFWTPFLFSQTPNNLYQYSVITALMEGNYDGELSFNELKEHGTFGLGTFNRLDGELIVLDGKFYQFTAEGKVNEVPGETLTPFAVVTYFKTDKEKSVETTLTLTDLFAELDGMIESANYIYAIKAEGTFSYIKTRSVPAQQKPYKKLVEVTKNQPTFEFENIEGTITGFRFPSYTDGINVPGYHFHFISADKKSGGHVLNLTTGKIKIEIAKQNSIELDFPSTAEFKELNLKKDAEALEKAEK